MIGADDRLALPVGVELCEGRLRDHMRGETFTLNDTAIATLRSATPAAAAKAVAVAYEIDERHALDDVLAFCARQNERLLLNVSPRAGAAAVLVRWAFRAPLLLPHGVLPTVPARRRDVDTDEVGAIVRSGVTALAGPAVVLGIIAAVGSGLLFAALGAAAATLAPAVGAALATAVVVHELAHLVALRGVPACVVTRGTRISVLHRALTPHRRRAVAASGPGAGLIVAACLLGALTVLPSVELGVAATVLSANAAGLTTCTRDGRTLCGLP